MPFLMRVAISSCSQPAAAASQLCCSDGRADNKSNVFIDVTRSLLFLNYFPRYANGLKSWMLLHMFIFSSAIFPFLTISSGTAYLCCDHLGLPCQTSTDQGHLPCVEYCTLGRKGRAWKMMRSVEMLWERFCGKMRTSRNKIFWI